MIAAETCYESPLASTEASRLRRHPSPALAFRPAKPARYFTEIPSPIGRLQLRGAGDALTALYMENHRHELPQPAEAKSDAAPFRDAIAQLAEYFAGERREFSLPLAAEGTDFQRNVWRGLAAIPYGATRSYGQLASAIGRPHAVRAVGLANGRNPISIIVPCHRVIGANGTLTGYGGGMERKRFLLDLERGGEPAPLAFF